MSIGISTLVVVGWCVDRLNDQKARLRQRMEKHRAKLEQRLTKTEAAVQYPAEDTLVHRADETGEDANQLPRPHPLTVKLETGLIGPVLHLWDFIHVFCRGGVLDVSPKACAEGMISVHPSIDLQQDLERFGNSKEKLSEIKPTKLRLSLQEASLRTLARALQSSDWRCMRFLNRLHMGLLRIILEDLEDATPDGGGGSDGEEEEDDLLFTSTAGGRYQLKPTLALLSPLTWPEVLRLLLTSAAGEEAAEDFQLIAGESALFSCDANPQR